MLNCRIVLLTAFSIFFFLVAQGQRVHFSQIELQKNGLYYQVNTIPPFTGTAYDVHPPLDPNDKKKAKEDYEAYLKTGRKSEEVNFKEGKKHGKAMGFDQLGHKIFQAHFVEGKKHGLEEQWYAKGEKKLEVPFENDKPNGIATEWHKNGKKKSESPFKNGREEGLHKWWFEDGSKDQEVPFKDGKANGIVKNWYPSGQIKLESSFKEGVHHGKTLEWHPNGQKKAEGEFVEGKENGTMSSWSSKGQILDEKIYEMGNLLKAMDYRSAGIRTKTGFKQVFNELQSNYSVSITGGTVKTINTRNIGFIIDGKILQLLNVPMDALSAGGATAQDKALEAFYASEMKQAAKDFGQAVEAQKEEMKINGKLNALYWKFEVPVKKGKENVVRRVLEEHFLAVVCKNDILLISSALTNNDQPAQISALLKKVADSIDISDKPIDLNAIRDAAIN